MKKATETEVPEGGVLMIKPLGGGKEGKEHQSVLRH